MEELITSHTKPHQTTESELVTQWLVKFEANLSSGSDALLSSLFATECHWRDLLAFTWSITPRVGVQEVVAGLMRGYERVHGRSFRIARDRTLPRKVKRVGLEVIEAIIEFETDTGRGQGVLRLLAQEPSKAWVLMTSLEELKGFEEPINERRPSGDDYSRIFGGPNWSDLRSREQSFADRDPDVMIVGAGQAGLSIAARLKRLGVDALVVDKLARVGDVWRQRYHALALHNKVPLNHMPYMPFPPSWPDFLPKDMLGNWLETYAWAMECNVWTSTTLLTSSYDEAAGRWRARVRLSDGSERELRPRHLVFANGVAGRPKLPQAPGLADFKGEMIHAHGYTEGSRWRGKKVLVLGTGTSGHDIAQDLHGHGAQVQLIQRGSITVASVKAAALNHALYYDEGLPTKDCDLISTSSTYPLLVRGYQLAVKRMLEIDKEVLEGLSQRGFKWDIGEDGTGHQMKFRRRFGGYYLNCGCSELIVNGEIGLLQYEDIEHFVPNGVRMKNGSIEEADMLVAATGYQSQREVVKEILGEEIAAKVGDIWGIAADGELNNMFRLTAQPGLWFAGGGFAQARIYSQYVALWIKAQQEGLLV